MMAYMKSRTISFQDVSRELIKKNALYIVFGYLATCFVVTLLAAVEISPGSGWVGLTKICRAYQNLAKISITFVLIKTIEKPYPLRRTYLIMENSLTLPHNHHPPWNKERPDNHWLVKRENWALGFSFSSVCLFYDHEFRHSVVKVAIDFSY